MGKPSDTRAKRIEGWKNWFRLRRQWGWNLKPIKTQTTSALSRAAKEFDLDPNKKSEREALLHVLADIAFGKAGRPRGSKKWTGRVAIQLGDDYRGVERDFPKLRRKQVIAKIKELHPERYKHITAETIRQRLPKAILMHELYYEKRRYDAMMEDRPEEDKPNDDDE